MKTIALTSTERGWGITLRPAQPVSLTEPQIHRLHRLMHAVLDAAEAETAPERPPLLADIDAPGDGTELDARDLGY